MITHDRRERLALKVMKALRKEWEREPDLLKCRKLVDVAGKLCKSQEEFDRVGNYLFSENLVKSVKRSDGIAYLPNEAGLDWIASQKKKWTPGERIAFIALILTVGTALVGLIVKWLDSR